MLVAVGRRSGRQTIPTRLLGGRARGASKSHGGQAVPLPVLGTQARLAVT